LSYVSLAIFWLYKLMDDHHIDKLTMLAWDDLSTEQGEMLS